MAHAAGASSRRNPAARPAAVVSCWLCGIALPQDQMVPDGGSACDNIRWYCQDTRACTGRWTQAQRQARAAGAAPPGSAIPAGSDSGASRREVGLHQPRGG